MGVLHKENLGVDVDWRCGEQVWEAWASLLVVYNFETE